MITTNDALILVMQIWAEVTGAVSYLSTKSAITLEIQSAEGAWSRIQAARRTMSDYVAQCLDLFTPVLDATVDPWATTALQDLSETEYFARCSRASEAAVLVTREANVIEQCAATGSAALAATHKAAKILGNHSQLQKTAKGQAHSLSELLRDIVNLLLKEGDLAAAQVRLEDAKLERDEIVAPATTLKSAASEVEKLEETAREAEIALERARTALQTVRKFTQKPPKEE